MSSNHRKKTARGKTAKNGTRPPLKFQSPPCAPTRAGRQAVTLKTDRPPAGWSSPVARQAHNLKVAGSNPAPATNCPETADAESKTSASTFLIPTTCTISASRPPSSTTKPASAVRSEEHTSELQSLMRISYAVFCLKKKTIINITSLHFTSQQMTIKQNT